MENSDYYGLTDEERLRFYDLYLQSNDASGLIVRLGGDIYKVSKFVVVGHESWSSGSPARCQERLSGRLIGIEIGRVLFDPGISEAGVRYNPLLGMLRRRSNEGDFELEPVHPSVRSTLCTELYINLVREPGDVPPSHSKLGDVAFTSFGQGRPKHDSATQRRFRNMGAKAWLYWQIGETDVYSWFTPPRWGEMKEWLDYWLPQEEGKEGK